ncbi:response regulator transcription factor [Oceanospirillum linum]|uniref:DNA-binding response regulator n=1 Tax=Oceanospirillum linum TaxID=966 RepID=A0A1T1H8Y1_OCELI|nr:response regulator transcription factor [Oceanospirillum linum]OOV86319.1 DNA-binding response regulator [Oceanospirillum linum]SEG47522.1 two component transcriptional regulator, LuxR family [Oleiphilus messinensis]SMP31090.1 two component transcriptional regulator, LuxR family [Oceanospirillum linum]
MTEQASLSDHPKSASIKLLLVDDHPLVRDGIRARFEADDLIEVIGEAQNGQQALDFVEHRRPDVVLMDVSMPVMNGLEATQHLRNRYPSVPVLILSMHDSREYIQQLVQTGASGYVLKDVGSDELVRAIQTVHQGGSYFSAGVSRVLFQGQPDTTEQKQALTPREETVLRYLAEGNSNKEIARQLDISVRTVETHRQNIKQKLDIHTAAGLARYAVEEGLVS